MLLLATFFVLHLLLSVTTAGAQGVPLIRNYTAEEYGAHNRCHNIEIGDDGTVFVANFEGLLYYDRAQWRIIHTPEISRVTMIHRASDNTVWLGGHSFFARLQTRANGELTMQPVGKSGLFEGEVTEIYEDGGSLRFIASDNNIYEVKGGTDIVLVEALKEDANHAISEDITQTLKVDGGLQVKVKKGSGLVIADEHGHDLYTITEADGLCSNQVTHVAYDGHGMLWGATLHGVFSIELPSVYSYLMAKNGLTGEVHAITAFDGKIYVGGTNGVYTIEARRCRRIDSINNICWTLCQQRDGLLAATSSGIYRIMAGGAVCRLTSYATTGMLVDGDKVYAGEPDGVWLYESGFQQRTKAVDLPLVTDIRKDIHGNPWYRNVHGRTVGSDPVMPHEPIADLPKNLFTPVSHIAANAQYRNGAQVWIGGDEILAVVDTDKRDLAALTDSRNLRFRSIVMGNDSVLWGGFGDMPKTLGKLDSDEGRLHFFYALDYAPLSGKTLYRYRLSRSIASTGGQWSPWTEKHDVELLNLPSGSFTLSVQAQLANGELSEVVSIDFNVAYPLLMRWYMVLLYFVVLAYIVYQLFRYRLKRLQKDKMKLEKIVEERTADLRSAQNELIRQEKMATVGKLTQGLIDRILNPMNYIINFSKMSNDLLNDLKENIDHNKDTLNEDDYEDTLDLLNMLTENLQCVDQYGQNTTRTLKAMEEMLKDHTGGYVDMDLLPVLQQDEQMADNYFATAKEQHRVSIVFTLPAAAMPLHGNPHMLSRVVMNLLGNAVYSVVKKASKTQSTPYSPEVSLIATVADGQYVLKIRDNGVGIEEQIIDKVFDPFFTTKTTGEASGIGLYLSREIVQNHGGNISVASVKDEFAEFTITLPQSQLHNTH